ncbi:hypothetical protein [Nocardia sp. NPDC057227]|uniref:hypothetical protein n=1 Tax=Nocardia sp. NPDC057227 TaxID=3346056 RepID=UPI00362FC73A
MSRLEIGELCGRVAAALGDRVTGGRCASEEAELELGSGGTLRFWVEDGAVRAEIDSRQGGPEIWGFGPGGDEVDDFLETVLDVAS